MAATRRWAAAIAVIALGCVSCATGGGGQDPGDPSGPEGTSEPAAPDPLFGDPLDPLFEEPEPLPSGAPVSDPLEEGNRVVFVFNQKLDDWFWSPITRAYRFVTPEPVRVGVRRALRNLNTPVYVANHVLQLRMRDAAQALGSFALNSTLGMFGLFEPARDAGWEVHPADFGQTLGLIGIGSGPYLVVPVFGPTSVRDGFGDAVDYFLQPLNYIIGVPTQLLWGGGAGLSMRDEFSDQLDALERSSVDFYSVMRSAYQQDRSKSIEEARSRRNEDFAAVVPESWRCGEHRDEAATAGTATTDSAEASSAR